MLIPHCRGNVLRTLRNILSHQCDCNYQKKTQITAGGRPPGSLHTTFYMVPHTAAHGRVVLRDSSRKRAPARTYFSVREVRHLPQSWSVKSSFPIERAVCRGMHDNSFRITTVNYTERHNLFISHEVTLQGHHQLERILCL